MPGAKAFVPRRWPTAEQAIELIRAAGGVAVIAHPYWDISEPDEVERPDPLARRRRGRDLLPDPQQGADRAPAGALRGARPRPHRLLRLPRPDPQDLRQVRRLRDLRPRRAAGAPAALARSSAAAGMPRGRPVRPRTYVRRGSATPLRGETCGRCREVQASVRESVGSPESRACWTTRNSPLRVSTPL